IVSPPQQPQAESWDAMQARDRKARDRQRLAASTEAVAVKTAAASPSSVQEAPLGILPQPGPAAPAPGDSPAFAAPLPSSDAPQTINNGFPALSINDSGFIPPDTMGAVGPNHFVEIINGAVGIFTKSGTRLSRVSLDSFFTVAVGATTYPRGGSFDPRVLYDLRSGRFFATAMERGSPSGQDNGIILAVSRTGNAAGTWDKYFLPVGQPNDTQSYFTDYSTLGVDDNGVYFGMTIFASGGGASVKLAAIPKAPLIAASPSLGALTQFPNVSGMYSSPQPALNFDPVAPTDPAFIVASQPALGNVVYRTITWSGGTPTLSSSTSVVNTPAFGNVLTAPASGSTTNINNGDFRLMMAVIRNGSLWTSRTVGVNASGGAPGADRNGCEWFQLGVSGSSLSLAQTGRVFDPAASNPRFYFYPSIVVNGQGHAAMGFSGVAASEFVGAYFTGRLSSDPAGTMGSVDLLKAGEGSYTRLDGSGRNRWGDYTYTSLDPNDDMTIWTIQEYAAASNNWRTWVAELLAPPPAAPISATPATVPRLEPTVTVVITGDATAGAGFYDPGPGFPNRLTASVSGGVVVNSVTYVDPTHVTLDLNTTSASPGPVNVTITNPDGQSRTGTGILTVGAPRAEIPIIDLNGSDGAGIDFAATFTEQTPRLAEDTDMTVTDANSANLASATVTLTNPLNGASETLSANTTGTSITANYNAGTGVLTLTGPDAVANFQQVLGTVTYNNTSDNPNTTARVITFTVTDTDTPTPNTSETATTTLSITAVNDPPIIALPSGAVTYPENAPAVILDAQATVADP
ncbi:MAG: hypothetical protein M3347_03195, partial [Armatimonadota bacterium]|nr:hypothetical protein [Armatimonadota bacterium]